MAESPSHGRRFSHTTLSERIGEQLIEDIYHGKYKPGDKIVEIALARELQVSQASVREALRSLIAMGFLESVPFKGIRVRSFTSKDLGDVHAVRIALETLAVQLAIERITTGELDDLEAIVERMVAAGKEGDIQKRIQFNIEFHEKLVQASDNKLISQLLGHLRFASWSMLTGKLSDMDPVFIASRHTILIEALRSRDPERVARAIREHVESTGKPLCDSLDDRDRAH